MAEWDELLQLSEDHAFQVCHRYYGSLQTGNSFLQESGSTKGASYPADFQCHRISAHAAINLGTCLRCLPKKWGWVVQLVFFMFCKGCQFQMAATVTSNTGALVLCLAGLLQDGFPHMERDLKQVEQLSLKLRSKASRLDQSEDSFAASRLLAHQGVNSRRFEPLCHFKNYASSYLRTGRAPFRLSANSR